MSQNFISGALIDPRSPIQKAADYQHLEVAGFTPPTWVEKTPSDWRKFPIRDQNGSGTCVAQTTAKLLGIENWLEEGKYIDFSANDIYQRRANKNVAGMWGQEALQTASKIGATTDERWPSQKLTEEQVNTPKMLDDEDRRIENLYRGGGYIMLPICNIDAVASVIQQTRKGIMVFFEFQYDEWTDVPKVGHKAGSLRHSLTGVDFTLYNGSKSIVIDDSWGANAGIHGQRVITEDFFNERNFFAGYLLDLSNIRDEKQPEPARPHHRFDIDLGFGMTNNGVKILQDILKFEQLYPQKIDSTGFYYQITAKAVMEFQRKYKVASEREIVGLNGHRCGPKTRVKLNELYA